MSGLTTHILDTARGRPAADVLIRLFTVDGSTRTLVRECRTNGDGRTDAPLIPAGDMRSGVFELEFHVGAYFAGTEIADDPPFLDVVPVRIRITDTASHYHIPLLVSPWSYSTYRGS